MTNSETFTRQYKLKVIFAFGVAIIILLNRVVGHSLLYSMKNPLFLFEQKEVVYNLFMYSHISQALTSASIISLIFDILLFVMPVLFIFTLNRVYALAFAALLITYFLTYNLVTGHHYHGLIGVILITIPFWTKNETRFNLLWEAVRYYWLYIFVSAALWKILRGSVFYTEQLSNILKSQQLDLLLQQPDSFQAHIVQYLITNPQVSHWVLIINVFVQLVFVVGFFTKKFDTILLLLSIVFCAANYFVMSIVSTELLILNLTLLNWEKIAALNLRNLSTQKVVS